LNASLEEALKAKAAISANQSELREQNEMYKVQISNLQVKIQKKLIYSSFLYTMVSTQLERWKCAVELFI